MIDRNYNHYLTKKEKQIFKAIVFEGLYYDGLMKKFDISKTTVITHLNAICQKLCIEGNNRFFQLQNCFWKEFLKMKNCLKCEEYDEELLICDCPESYYSGEFVNEYMICREFKEKKGKENEKLQ